MKILTEQQFIKRLIAYQATLGLNQKQLAERLGVSPQYISDVLAERRSAGDAIASKLGFKVITAYEAVEQ